jgi:hypothetical protein
VHAPEEREQVVLAEAVELDVFDEHHLGAVLVEDSLADDLLDRGAVAGGELLQAPRHAVGRARQPLTGRIFSQLKQELMHEVLRDHATGPS